MFPEKFVTQAFESEVLVLTYTDIQRHLLENPSDNHKLIYALPISDDFEDIAPGIKYILESYALTPDAITSDDAKSFKISAPESSYEFLEEQSEGLRGIGYGTFFSYLGKLKVSHAGFNWEDVYFSIGEYFALRALGALSLDEEFCNLEDEAQITDAYQTLIHYMELKEIITAGKFFVNRGKLKFIEDEKNHLNLHGEVLEILFNSSKSEAVKNIEKVNEMDDITEEKPAPKEELTNSDLLNELKETITETIATTDRIQNKAEDAQNVAERILETMQSRNSISEHKVDVVSETWTTMKGLGLFKGIRNCIAYFVTGKEVINDPKWYHLLMGYKLKVRSGLTLKSNLVNQGAGGWEFVDSDEHIDYESDHLAWAYDHEDMLDNIQSNCKALGVLRVPTISIETLIKPIMPVSKVNVSFTINRDEK